MYIYYTAEHRDDAYSFITHDGQSANPRQCSALHDGAATHPRDTFEISSVGKTNVKRFDFNLIHRRSEGQ